MAQQFLDDFDSKMNRLVDIRRNLQNSVQFKQQFKYQAEYVFVYFQNFIKLQIPKIKRL